MLYFNIEDYICNGSIELCKNCSDAVDYLPTDKEEYCRPFFKDSLNILDSGNKTSVFHNDTHEDCCWRVYSESNYRGENRLISGRERKGRKYIDLNCTNIDFEVRSVRRVCKNCLDE